MRRLAARAPGIADGVHAPGEGCASSPGGEARWEPPSMFEEGLPRRASLTAQTRGRQRVRAGARRRL